MLKVPRAHMSAFSIHCANKLQEGNHHDREEERSKLIRLQLKFANSVCVLSSKSSITASTGESGWRHRYKAGKQVTSFNSPEEAEIRQGFEGHLSGDRCEHTKPKQPTKQHDKQKPVSHGEGRFAACSRCAGSATLSSSTVARSVVNHAKESGTTGMRCFVRTYVRTYEKRQRFIRILSEVADFAALNPAA